MTKHEVAMPRLIDADTVVTVQTYDDEHEEWGEETLTIADALDKWADEGCPPTIDAEPVRHGELISSGYDEIYCEWGNCSKCGADNMMSNTRCCECGAHFDGRDDEK